MQKLKVTGHFDNNRGFTWPFVIITLHLDGAGFGFKVKFDQY